MKKSLLVVVALTISVFMLGGGNAFAGASHFLRRGYIQNDMAKKCWYTQKVDENNTYFQGLKNTVGIITFDNSQCMSGSRAEIDVDKTMINNVITHWYSHPDANFQTRSNEMYPGSMLQKKGQCIQSRTYRIIGVTVDYFTKGDSITGVIHGLALQGCTK